MNVKLVGLGLIGSLLLTLAACGNNSPDAALAAAAVNDPPQYGTPFEAVPDTRDIQLVSGQYPRL